jgi:hypothetical protein
MGITEKKCSKCGGAKPLTEFWKDSTRHDGVQGVCKGCKKEYQASPPFKEARKKYFTSEKGKAVQKRANARYYSKRTSAGVIGKIKAKIREKGK